jgi:hypothetical protein
VKKHGNDWVAVAALVSGRTNKQCYERWTRIDPSNNGKKAVRWTQVEDRKLTKAVKKHGNDWVVVATMVPGRSNKQCRERWTYILDPSNNGKNAGKWKPEEDGKLTKAVKKHGNDWVAVAGMVHGRSNAQCRVRWTDTLGHSNNGKSAGKWKPEEDGELTKAGKKHGNAWLAVAGMVHGRSNAHRSFSGFFKDSGP